MERFDYIRHGTMKLGKNYRCPVCKKKFIIKIEDRFGIDTPILIIKCVHDKEIYKYLFEESENHERRI